MGGGNGQQGFWGAQPLDRSGCDSTSSMLRGDMDSPQSRVSAAPLGKSLAPSSCRPKCHLQEATPEGSLFKASVWKRHPRAGQGSAATDGQALVHRFQGASTGGPLTESDTPNLATGSPLASSSGYL